MMNALFPGDEEIRRSFVGRRFGVIWSMKRRWATNDTASLFPFELDELVCSNNLEIFSIL